MDSTRTPRTTALREQMRADLQLAGLSEAELRQYFLFLKNEKHFAPASLKLTFCGLAFFYTHTAPREWPTLQQLKIPVPKSLPDVLTREEVRRIVDAPRTPHNQTYFWTLHSLGLRMTEALFLQVGDIDSARRLLHVHRGKGAKDRYVPLPSRTLHLLRQYWATHRNARWLFPAVGRDQHAAATATHPMPRRSVQGALRRVVRSHQRLGYAALFRASSEAIKRR